MLSRARCDGSASETHPQGLTLTFRMKVRPAFLIALLQLASSAFVAAHDRAIQSSGAPEWFSQAKAAPTSSSSASFARAERIAESFAPFKPKVRYTWDENYFYEESDGFPDRTRMPNLMVGITAWNQQIPIPAAYFAGNSSSYWKIPLAPVPASTPYAITRETFLRGAIALGADGIPIFNPANNTGRYSYDIGELDAYGGHSGMADDYHYHIAPTHLTSVLGDNTPIAWVLDGYPMYGYVEPDGAPLQPLDSCGGHDHGGLGYHYHAIGRLNGGQWVPTAPFMNAKFYGTVAYVDRQVDPQPSVTPIRREDPTGVGYQAQPLEVKITRFANPVALKASGEHYVEDTQSSAIASPDAFLMSYTHAGATYDLCWKINRTAKTITTTWRLPAGAKTATGSTPQATTVTTTYPATNGNRISAYPMSGASLLKLPDTGQITGLSDALGEDADYLQNPPSFTLNGDGTVTDQVTGLMWQSIDNGESTWNAAIANAGTVKTGGHSDWRLPTPSELFSLFNFSRNNPALDTQYFPNNPAGAAQYWWTSDVYGGGTSVWCGNAGGGMGPKPVTETLSAGGNERFHTRYVRNATPTNAHNYHNNADGTVTDLDTGLMWVQSPSAAMDWKSALEWAEGLTQSGYSDWRLPNIKELQSLIDYTLTSATSSTATLASINRVLFPSVAATAYWSSTTQQSDQTKAWLAEFGVNNNVLSSNGPNRGFQGIISYEAKTSAYPVLAVRTTSLAKQIEVKQSEASLVDGASTVSFGDVLLGTSIEKNFTIFNSGTSGLSVSGITLDGIDSSCYVLTGSLTGSLTAGGSMNFGVRFTSSSTGTKSAALHIASSDPLVGTAFDIELSAIATTTAPTLASATLFPAATGDIGGPWIIVSGSAAAGASLSNVSVSYADGATSTSTVFNEPMASTASKPWTGTGTTHPWTLSVSGPQDTFSQALPTSSLGFSGYALLFDKGTTSATDSMVTTKDNIMAAGISGSVEFKMATLDLIPANGWTFQVSSDGGTTWQTRLSESGQNHVAKSYLYPLAASELVNTLKLRFQFVGYDAKPPARAPQIYLDDLRVKVTAKSPAKTYFLKDDGAHQDGAAGDGVYGGQVPNGSISDPSAYSVTLTDSNGKSAEGSATLGTLKTTLTPSSFSAPAIGGNYSMEVSSFLPWTALGAPSWIQLSSSTGTTGTVKITVSPNPSGTPRNALITLGGQPLNLSQAAQSLSANLTASVCSPLTLTPPVNTTAKSYKATTSLPLGLILNSTTGVISGKPISAGTYSFKVTPFNASGAAGDSFTYTLKVDPLHAGLIGTFSGLLDAHPSLTGNLAGLVQLTITSTGSSSGKLVVGAKSVTFTNVGLNVNPDTPSEATLSISTPTLGSGVTLSLTLNGITQRLTGKLSNASQESPVSGTRLPWSSSNPPSPYAGRYPVRFAQNNADASLPQGFGFSVFSVTSPLGTTTFLLTLPDGTKVSSSTRLGLDGEIILFVPLGSGKGGVAGTLRVAASDTAPLGNTVTGRVQWTKPPVTGTIYSAGFGPITLDVSGGHYNALAPGQRVMGLPASSSNAKISFSKGGLDTEGLEFARTITISNPSVTGSTNIVKVDPIKPLVTLSNLVSTSYGGFTGTLTLPSTSSTAARTVIFQGQIVTVGSLSKGYGFFLLPQPPLGKQTLSTSPKLSGQILLEAQEIARP